jgi:hypothetical protein
MKFDKKTLEQLRVIISEVGCEVETRFDHLENFADKMKTFSQGINDAYDSLESIENEIIAIEEERAGCKKE